ncbi:hypothetical protein VE02_01659 [Pseudogymnoascus sp. 03VT05]|nr:hypothetical protein VE02_01659 [Pseudogymnoascus sp. 03VT05]
MNDESASAPAAGPGDPQPPPSDDAAAAAETPAATPPPGAAGIDDNSPAARRRRRIFIQTKKKAEFIHDILVNLDMLIYAELCFMYYNEYYPPPPTPYLLTTYEHKLTSTPSCSLFRFLLRSITQLVFLSPAAKPPPIPGPRPFIPALLSTNMLCIFLHLVTARPSGSELTRGYLHGGIIVDFIGQRAPSTKALLVGLDILILVLQLVMLSVHVEEAVLKAALANRDGMTAYIAGGGTGVDPAERGGGDLEMGTGAQGVEMGVEMEMHDLSAPEGAGAEERDVLLAESMRRAEEGGDAGVVDAFYTGNVVVGTFDVVGTVRAQWGGGEGGGRALVMAGQTAGYEWARARGGVTRRLGTMA